MSEENERNGEDRVSYWAKRLRADNERLSEERKLEILTALLHDYIELSEYETSLFLAKETPLDKGGVPTASDFEYLSAEGKVADFYASEDGGDNDSNRLAFLDSFRSALKGFYSEGELDEMFNYLTPRGDTLVVTWLVGREHHVIRRIRNAYLPLITDVFEVGPEGGRDIDIFDDDEEPGDNMDRFLEDSFGKKD